MTAAPDRQRYALQTIFSFFLGLMVLAFIGIAVNTFYPSPSEKYTKETQAIVQQQESLNRKSQGKTMTPAEQVQFDALQKQMNDIQTKQEAEMKIWARNTSIVLILFATGVMALSLIRSEQLRVISNGLLLGGLFCMVYGSGWVIFSGNSTARFYVIAFALVVTVALGYLKFVRQREAVPAALAGGTIAVDDVVVGDLSARVSGLEAKLDAIAEALAPGHEKDAGR